MTKRGSETRSNAKRGREPGWWQNTVDQREWCDRFRRILKRDCSSLDAAISAILSDEQLSQMCATLIRSYLDKDVTGWLYNERKERGLKHRKRLETAISGINTAVGLYTDRGNPKVAQSLGVIAIELSAELGRCRYAYASKRHGRDRAHLILWLCRSALESELGPQVTYPALANLVNAGFEDVVAFLKLTLLQAQLAYTHHLSDPLTFSFADQDHSENPRTSSPACSPSLSCSSSCVHSRSPWYRSSQFSSWSMRNAFS